MAQEISLVIGIGSFGLVVAAACLPVMSQNAQRCPSTSLLNFADYAGVLFSARARQIRVRSSRTLVDSAHRAVYGEPYPSAKDTVYFEPPAAIARAG